MPLRCRLSAIAIIEKGSLSPPLPPFIIRATLIDVIDPSLDRAQKSHGGFLYFIFIFARRAPPANNYYRIKNVTDRIANFNRDEIEIDRLWVESLTAARYIRRS